MWVPSAFYMGIYFLWSAGSWHLFGPRRLYEHCFYSDKYGMLKGIFLISTEFAVGLLVFKDIEFQKFRMFCKLKFCILKASHPMVYDTSI